MFTAMTKAGPRIFIAIRRLSASAAEVPKAAAEVAQRPLHFNEASTFTITGKHAAAVVVALLGLFVTSGGAIIFGVRYLVEKDIAGMEGKLSKGAQADATAAAAAHASAFLTGKVTFPHQITEAIHNAKVVEAGMEQLKEAVKAMEQLKAAVADVDKIKAALEAKGPGRMQ